MCTVTYTPNHETGFILTSNRGENVNRTKEEIFNFYKNGTIKEPLLMKYTNNKSPIETISITQVDCTLSNPTLSYTSLLEKSTTSQAIQHTIIETA